MATTQISTSVTIISSLLGYQAVSLSALDTTSVPSILAGSKLEVASAFFTWGTDETPNASSWTAIATTTTAYLACTPSGSAGNQILTSSYVASVPTWSGSKQGWYTTGDTARVIASMYKGGATNSQLKAPLTALSNPVQFALGGNTPIMQRDTTGSGAVIFRYGIAEQTGAAALKTKVIEIGEWNMDAANSVNVAHGLSSALSRIVAISAIISNDGGTIWYPIEWWDVPSLSVSGAWSFNGTNVIVQRTVGAAFDAVQFDATASTVANRGYVTVVYIA